MVAGFCHILVHHNKLVVLYGCVCFQFKTWRNTGATLLWKLDEQLHTLFQWSYMVWTCSHLSMSAHLVGPEELRKSLRPRGRVGLQRIVYNSSGRGWKYSHASQTQPVWGPITFSITAWYWNYTDTKYTLRWGWLSLACETSSLTCTPFKSWSTSSFL